MGLISAALLVLVILQSFSWDPSIFLHVGEDAAELAVYTRERLGSLELVPGHGHDGKYYFVQAHDPLLRHPETFLRLFDRPVYRIQRMLYPLMASSGLLFGERGLAWSLIVVNVMATGLGTWATAKLAQLFGLSHWWGMAFVLNPGVMFELIVGGGGVLAWALGVVGLWLLGSKQELGAVAAFSAAGLAREAMVLVALGSALLLWSRRRRLSLSLLVWPTGTVAAWGIYARFRLGYAPSVMQSIELGPPLKGWWEAAIAWPQQGPLDTAVGLVVAMLVVALVYQALVRPSLITYGAVGFAFLAPLLTQAVLSQPFDSTRALAPVFTCFVLGTAAGSGIPQDPLDQTT